MRWPRRLEPLWWGLFAAGGTLAALLLPAHIFVNNIAAPLGWLGNAPIAFDSLASLVRAPLIKLYLLVLLVPTLYHAAHRLGPLPHELALPVPLQALRALAYLAATAAALACIVVVLLAP